MFLSQMELMYITRTGTVLQVILIMMTLQAMGLNIILFELQVTGSSEEGFEFVVQ